MADASPLHVLLAAGPSRPGAAEVVRRATAAGGSVLVTGEGLDWLRDADLLARARDGAVTLALCSRSARDRKVNPVLVPPHVRWSSLTAWFRDLPAGAPLACAFP